MRLLLERPFALNRQFSSHVGAVEECRDEVEVRSLLIVRLVRSLPKFKVREGSG